MQDKLPEEEDIFLDKCLRKIFEQSNDVYWVRGSSYDKQIFVNKAYEEVWGRSQASLYQAPERWIDTVHPDDRAALEYAISKRIATSSSKEKTYETYRILRPDGTVRWIRDKYFALFDDAGQLMAHAGIARDITNEVSQEQEILEAKVKAEEANRAKSDFLAMMSHELRTPLNAMMGAAQILHSFDLTKEQLQYVDIVYKSGENLLSLINDILDFAKLEAGKLDIVSVKFHLRNLVEETVDHFSQVVREKSIDLIVDYDPEVNAVLMGDAKRIRQILINLINNAVKFTREGYIVVSVNLVERDMQRVVLQFSVSDTGIGIPKDKLETIFERFTQVMTAEHIKYDGVGLGLSITKQLVEMMGGHIFINSQEGRGTIFYCNIPFLLIEQDKEEEQKKWIDFQKNHRILFIDDNLPRARGLARQLMHSDSSEEHFIKGSQSLEKFENAQKNGKPYDMVVIDQQLTTMNSLELVSYLKSHPAFSEMFIVLMIKPTTAPERNALKSLGCSEFLIKPVQPSELQRMFLQEFDQFKQNKKYQEAKERYQAKVLLIEDNELNQRIATVMLQGFGCEVDLASSGQEALDKLKNKYDIVFVDIALPDISGLKVTTTYRESMEGDIKTPFIALTAHVQEHDKEKCFNAGIDQVLTKPILRDQLQDVLKQYSVKETICYP